MYRKWDSTEYFDLFAAEDMDSGELCMLAPECSRKTEENLKLAQSVDNDQPEEALYFSRYEVMEKLLLHQYPSLSESFTDHMIELLYAELF